jgi:hypothetical protein
MPKGEPIVVTPEKIFGANPKQFEAWTKSWEHQFLLYGGAAGGGKSFFLRWWCVFYLMALAKLNNVPRAVVGLFCEDYPSLEGSAYQQNPHGVSAIPGDFQREQVSPVHTSA